MAGRPGLGRRDGVPRPTDAERKERIGVFVTSYDGAAGKEENELEDCIPRISGNARQRLTSEPGQDVMYMYV